MACSCDSCSSPRIIKTRTADVSLPTGDGAERVISVEIAQTRRDAQDEVDLRRLDRCRAEFLELLG